MIGRRVDWQMCLGHAAKQRSQDLRRWQLDPGDQAELGITEVAAYGRCLNLSRHSQAAA